MLGHFREHGGKEVRPGERLYREEARVEQETFSQCASHHAPHGAGVGVLRRLQLQRLHLDLELGELPQMEVGRRALRASGAQRQGELVVGRRMLRIRRRVAVEHTVVRVGYCQHLG